MDWIWKVLADYRALLIEPSTELLAEGVRLVSLRQERRSRQGYKFGKALSPANEKREGWTAKAVADETKRVLKTRNFEQKEHSDKSDSWEER
jgi:hypothetical protein